LPDKAPDKAGALFFREAVESLEGVCHDVFLYQLWLRLITHHTLWITSEKFNEYESAMTGRLSDRDTENAELREEVRDIKGQRNTLLAIVITAASVALLLAAFKILRFFKVLPF
jgi:hypothetical protein